MATVTREIGYPLGVPEGQIITSGSLLRRGGQERSRVLHASPHRDCGCVSCAGLSLIKDACARLSMLSFFHTVATRGWKAATQRLLTKQHVLDRLGGTSSSSHFVPTHCKLRHSNFQTLRSAFFLITFFNAKSLPLLMLGRPDGQTTECPRRGVTSPTESRLPTFLVLSLRRDKVQSFWTFFRSVQSLQSCRLLQFCELFLDLGAKERKLQESTSERVGVEMPNLTPQSQEEATHFLPQPCLLLDASAWTLPEQNTITGCMKKEQRNGASKPHAQCLWETCRSFSGDQAWAPSSQTNLSWIRDQLCQSPLFFNCHQLRIYCLSPNHSYCPIFYQFLSVLIRFCVEDAKQKFFLSSLFTRHPESVCIKT